MGNEIISVIMPVYNANLYLTESINSILNQTYDNFEFIILNDGSQDNSKDIILSFNDKRIKYFEHDNIGIQKTLNRGLFESKGSFIARMDADDISFPERFEKQIHHLKYNNSIIAVGTNAIYIDKNGEELYLSNHPTRDEEIRKTLLSGGRFFHSSMMFYKSIALNCGGYFDKCKTGIEDGIMWIRMSKIGKLSNLSEPLIKYRIVPSALSNTNRNRQKYMRNIFISIDNNEMPSDLTLMKLDNFNKKETNSWKNGNYHFRISIIYIKYCKNGFKSALKNIILALKYNPLNIFLYIFLFFRLIYKNIFSVYSPGQTGK